MSTIDLLITNATIIDGTGSARYSGDIAIDKGQILETGTLSGYQANETIDADGKIVAPGYITQHSHYDAAIFWDPYCSDSGEHGVTTVLNGNCGFSIAPVRGGDRERIMLMLSTTEQVPVEQQKLGMPWDWETFPEYMESLSRQPKGVNVMTYMPMNPLIVYVMGIEAAKTRRPTKSEIAQMHSLINEAMDIGAVGISMSVMGAEGNSHLDYDGTCMPTDLLHDDDVVEIARAVAERGEGIIQILSQIGPFGNRQLSEKVAEMAKGSGARVLHNVLLTMDGIPELVDESLEWIDGVREKGCDLLGAALVTTGWVETSIRELDVAAGQMSAVREIMALEGDDQGTLKLISDPDFVKRFADEYANNGPTNGAGGFEGQIVLSVGDATELQEFVGRSLIDIAEETDRNVVEVLCDLGAKSNLDLMIKSPPFAATDGSHAAKLLRHPAVAGGVSDGGAHTKAFSVGWYGTDLITRVVREQKIMSLEEVHYQLSLKVARFLKIEGRGAILPGFAADLVIYDLDKLYVDRSEYITVNDMPGGDWRKKAKAGGYDRIIVNGVTTHIDDTPNGATPGRIVRITQARQPVLAAAE